MYIWRIALRTISNTRGNLVERKCDDNHFHVFARCNEGNGIPKGFNLLDTKNPGSNIKTRDVIFIEGTVETENMIYTEKLEKK